MWHTEEEGGDRSRLGGSDLGREGGEEEKEGKGEKMKRCCPKSPPAEADRAYPGRSLNLVGEV